jgi:hypothetical protein
MDTFEQEVLRRMRHVARTHIRTEGMKMRRGAATLLAADIELRLVRLLRQAHRIAALDSAPMVRTRHFVRAWDSEQLSSYNPAHRRRIESHQRAARLIRRRVLR